MAVPRVTLTVCLFVVVSAAAPAQVSTSLSYRLGQQSTRSPAGSSAASSYAVRACLAGNLGGGLATSTSYRLQSGCGSAYQLGLDYGDAPAPYPSLRADDGARHALATPLVLGSTVRAELDARASDDTSDDGISFLGLMIPGAMGNVEVTVSVSGSKLDAWIDFNADGDWDDGGEQIFIDENLPLLVNPLSFAVPAGMTQSSIAARFRVSSAGGLDATGFAADGEVEDYEVATVPVTLQSFVVE